MYSKKNKLDLSIIIPHYNSSKLLLNLLDTLPNRNDIEIFIIDDKSDLSHIKYIEKFISNKQFNNLFLIKNNTNKKGAGVCRNIGLNHASGQWVLFADADDYFTDNFYNIITPYLKTNNDVIFFPPTSIYIDTRELATRHIHFEETVFNNHNSKNKNTELNLRYNMAPPWSKIITRNLLISNKIEFDEIIASNDVMFSLKVGKNMKYFDTSPDIIYVITRNHGSLTTDMSESIYDARLNIFIKRSNFLKNLISKNEIKLLKFNYRIMLLKSLRYGVIKFFYVCKVFYINKISIYEKKFLNPFLTIKLIIKLFKNSDYKYRKVK
jgi:glycosyltransferase involved in cell wall biosynthesis